MSPDYLFETLNNSSWLCAGFENQGLRVLALGVARQEGSNAFLNAVSAAPLDRRQDDRDPQARHLTAYVEHAALLLPQNPHPSCSTEAEAQT